jgi:flagellar basal body rod protein FlgB
LQHFSQQPSDGNNVSVRAWMDEFTKNLNMYTHTGMSFSLNKEWNLAIVDTWMSQENVTLTDIVR